MEEVTKCCCGNTHRPVPMKNDDSVCNAWQRNFVSHEKTAWHVSLLHHQVWTACITARQDIEEKFLNGIIFIIRCGQTR